MNSSASKMKIEIWSDVVCPFCYLGKRKFEKALSQFSGQESITVEWKSFQLMPDLVTDPSKSIYELLSEKKGISLEQAKEMNAYVTEAAKALGLVFNLDKAVVANTMKAHGLLHFAKAQHRQDDMEEALFKAYFTEGKNIDDPATLQAIANDAGLNTDGLAEALESGRFEEEIHQDIYEAQQVGASGVPFFVLNGKYAVSGAQEPVTFLQTLEKSFAEWAKENPTSGIEVSRGEQCDVDGKCD